LDDDINLDDFDLWFPLLLHTWMYK
jgi:hypothetical protein